jgi:hypothetical protein
VAPPISKVEAIPVKATAMTFFPWPLRAVMLLDHPENKSGEYVVNVICGSHDLIKN